MNMFPKVFVIVLNYNGREFIKACLNSVFKMSYPAFEVVVVDNNSRDGSLELARSLFSRVHFIKNEENVGFAAGNNVGIKFALERGASWVLMLNQDTEVEKNLLERLVKAGERDEKTGILSPLVYWGDSPAVWFSGGKISWLRMRSLHSRNKIYSINYKCDFVSGCSMMVKKEVFAKAGLLDEDFFLYWEDADFCYRARKAGFNLAVVPDTSIKHFEKNAEPSGNKIYWLVLSGLMFFQKNATVYQKLWIRPYVIMRRIKNWLDIKRGKEEAGYVQKAYRDYYKSCLKTK